MHFEFVKKNISFLLTQFRDHLEINHSQDHVLRWLYFFMHNVEKWSDILEKSCGVFVLFGHLSTLCMNELRKIDSCQF